MSAPGRLTSTEVRLAEQYVRVLDFVSRCALAVDRGDWFYLYDKASQLQDAAKGLRAVAGEAWQEVSAGQPPPRRQAMRAAVAWWGRHYRAGRLLHPTEPGRPGGEPRW
ncbi:MAG TPA: hypothetical protein VGM21_11170 [Actinomycetota bacterium]